MDHESKMLRHLLSVFQLLVQNMSRNDQFDYHYGPINEHTDWNTVQSNSLRTVYSTDGPNAPQINLHEPLEVVGVVITFSAPVGGDNQIFFNDSILALRQIGNPAGWSYLGLDPSQKIYMDDDAADILSRIMGNIQYHDYVTLDSDQEIDGNKDFENTPTVDGQPLIGHDEFAKLTSYVWNDYNHINTLFKQVEYAYSLLDGYDNDLIDFKQMADRKYATKDELANYAPLNQLSFYATKKDLDNVLTLNDFNSVLAEYVKKSDLPNFSDLSDVKGLINKTENNSKLIAQNLHQIDQKVNFSDFEALRRLVRRINRRRLPVNENNSGSSADLTSINNSIDKLEDSARSESDISSKFASELGSSSQQSTLSHFQQMNFNSSCSNGLSLAAMARNQLSGSISDVNSAQNNLSNSTSQNYINNEQQIESLSSSTAKSFANFHPTVNNVSTSSVSTVLFNQAEYDGKYMAGVLQAELNNERSANASLENKVNSLADQINK